MQETEKYKLKKPDADDFFDIEDFNENTDKIEQALKENAEGVEELKAPSFDDSGTVDGINSFTDFLNSVKNKMNIFQFFKNFKAGMKFILHTGMIVDNYATKEKGFLPDATLVTSLKEQLDEQNNNIVDGYFLRDTVNDRTKIKNTGFYQLTDDIPVSGAEYFAYSFGRQGKHWSYPVFLFNNWGDSVPLRMFQLQSADGQNYTASDYKQIITNSDIQRGSVLITPASANTPQKYSLVFPKSFSSVPSVVATPNTGVSSVTATITDITKTGCNIWLTRPNIVATTVHWIATSI